MKVLIPLRLKKPFKLLVKPLRVSSPLKLENTSYLDRWVKDKKRARLLVRRAIVIWIYRRLRRSKGKEKERSNEIENVLRV